MTARRAWPILTLVAVLTACGSAEGSRGYAAPAPQTPPPSAPTAEMTVLPDDLRARLVDDLASRTGTDPGDVAVVRGERRTFSDGSLGCPQPGQFYTQALVEGYRVVLKAAGRTYDYRVSDRGAFVLCERRLKPGG